MRAALVTPLSGPLAGYGRAGAAALRLWAAGAGARLSVFDAHPDPVAALRQAEHEAPEVLFGPYGSGPARAVAAATRRVVFNHGGARAAGPRLVSVLAPAETYFEGAVALVGEPVMILHGDTGFGRAVGEGAERAARARGLAVTRGVLAEGGEAAAGGGPAPARPGGLVLVAGDFASERAAAAALLPGAWTAAGFVSAGVEEVLAPAVREGLLGPAQWLATAATEPDEGPAAAEFAAAYRAATGDEPPYPAAQAFAAGVIAGRCLRAAGPGAGDDGLLAAARALTCTTLLGRFALDPRTGAQTGQRVLTVQWQDGERRVVHPLERAQAPVRLRPWPRST